MESKSIKEKILYWGGITLISTVIIGGSYYIYESLFGSEEKEKEEKEENENNSINNSFQLNDSNQNDQKNNNIEISTSNNINNINSTIFSKNENMINIGETENNNIINNNNIDNKLIKDEEVSNDENEEKKIKNINIFDNNMIFLKSFGLNIEESKIFKNGNNKLTEEIAIRLIIYINYLAEKFYMIDNPSLDEKRRSLLNKNNNNELLMEQEYLTLCNETLVYKQYVYQIAASKIMNSLKIKITMEDLRKYIRMLDARKLEELSIKILIETNSELNKYDLDMMDINKTKESYIFYLKLSIDCYKKLYEQIENDNININNNIEENNNPMYAFQYMTIKRKTDDILYLKYNIVEEHLKLLVYKHNLSNDNEVSQLQNEFYDINQKFGNMAI